MLLRDYGSHQGPGGPGGPDTFSAVVRFAFVAGLLTLGITSFTLFHHPPTGAFRSIQDHIPLRKPPPDFEVVQTLAEYNDLVAKIPDPDRHPIDRLIADALDKQASLLAQQSHNVDDAARKYRERRGRHPPPGFDAWMKYAVNHDAVVVESFFDRIYHDLAPFWALPPNITATRAESWHHVVRVRNGVARGVGDTTGLVAWLDLWTSLVAEAAPYLPDVDMPINYMDESRLLVPWETIAGYVATERRTRQLTPAADTLQHYTGLAAVDALGGGNGSRPYDPEWISAHSPRYWDLARVTCPPNSPSRHVRALSDFSRPASLPSDWRPPFAFEGYVQNFSAAADPCTQPHLRGLHGTFVEPLSMSSAAELIPLFGGSKLTMNNEILIPGAMYLTDDPFYSGGAGHGPPWAFKNRTVVWRGAASGGRNKKENWTRFQRHRLLEMLNATTVSRLEAREAKGRSKGRGKGKGKDAPARTFDMAPVALYDYPRRRNGTVGELLRSVSDTGFTDLLCFPAGECGYIQPHFHAVPGMPMAAQYGDKFIPDADGNSFSARFRGLLLSTSLPLKATIYAEWHDDRLQPWLHFAPLDNTFQDLHAVLDFFLDGARGDAAAHLLAASGKRWAEQVLRRDDMLLYVWRLLLEFARVCDENRHRLGYVDDLPAAST